MGCFGAHQGGCHHPVRRRSLVNERRGRIGSGRRTKSQWVHFEADSGKGLLFVAPAISKLEFEDSPSREKK